MFGTPKMEDNGIDIDDWDAPIYRIFSKQRFICLITTRMNGLVNPTMWDDPYDNFFLKCTAVDTDGTRVSLESLSKSWYGQCWTRNRDSDAMWRIYSHDKHCVRVSTTIRKLFASFYDARDPQARLKYFIGSVEYKDRGQIEQFLRETTFTDLAIGGQTRPFAKTLCIKRQEFSHENEVRLLFYDDVGNNRDKRRVARFPFDLDVIISEVALDPRLMVAQFQQEKSQLIDFGCNVPIIQSDLYQISLTTIRL